MGLDTSIVLAKEKEELTPSWFIKLNDSYCVKIKDKKTTEICYWRNCYGVREILDKILGHADGGDLLEIKFDDIPAVARALSILMNPDEWYERSESIWGYDDYSSQQTKNLLNLLWLGEYLKNNPEEKAYYVNNY